MMGWNNAGWGAGQWVAMSLMMLIFWVAVIGLGVWLVRSTRRTPRTPGSAISDRATATDGAQRLLAERFARGEIDETEFTRSRTLLRTPTATETSR
jgi:putative membrane protein